MGKNITNTIWHIPLFLGLQILFFRNVVLFQYAFCYLYIAIILFLPVETGTPLQLLLGFFSGLLVDIVSDTLGMHAFAAVLLAYFRHFVLTFLAPPAGYEAGVRPYFQEMGGGRFAAYALSLIFMHHFAFFLIEAAGFAHILLVLTKTLASTAFTFLVILIGQLLFFRQKRKW